jgi:twinkle protein
MTIHPKHKEWISGRGIDPALAEALGICTTQDGGGYWLSVPYAEAGRVINHKHRLTSEKRHRMDSGAPLLWWNLDCLTDDRLSDPAFPVVITEGEWDALAAMQAGRPHVLSVPNGAPAKASDDAPVDPLNDAERFAFLHRSAALTDKVARFIIATDGDGPGRILAWELVRRLGAERCLFVSYPEGCKDLNDVLLTGGEGAVAALLSDAKPYPIKGLARVADFPEPPPLEPIRVRIPEMYDLLPVVPGTFAVVTGFAGQGKTSFIMAVVGDLLKQGVNVAIGSFETAIRPILETKLRSALRNCSDNDTLKGGNEIADKIINAQISIIAQHPTDDDADMSLEEVLELARIAVIRDGVKMVILDPWNEVEHKRRGDESETDYTGRAIRMMKRFARQYQVALWLVAHPRKPVMDRGSVKAPTLYDIAGSANFANKADYGVVIHRPQKGTNEVDVHVTKVRMGLPGRMDSVRLAWDWKTSRYERCVTLMESLDGA